MTDSLLHFPMYIGDYLKETMSFTQEERGAYMDLCIAYIQNNGPLPDDQRVFILTRCFSEHNQTTVSTVVKRAFKRENGLIISEYLDALIDKQIKLREQRREAGKKSAEKKRENQRAFVQSESESDIYIKNKKNKKTKKILNEDKFEEFWNLYGKDGVKKRAQDAWNKISVNTSFDEIISGVNKYNEYCKNETWYKKQHASTWINGQCWDDEWQIRGEELSNDIVNLTSEQKIKAHLGVLNWKRTRKQFLSPDELSELEKYEQQHGPVYWNNLKDYETKKVLA